MMHTVISQHSPVMAAKNPKFLLLLVMHKVCSTRLMIIIYCTNMYPEIITLNKI